MVLAGLPVASVGHAPGELDEERVVGVEVWLGQVVSFDHLVELQTEHVEQPIAFNLHVAVLDTAGVAPLLAELLLEIEAPEAEIAGLTAEVGVDANGLLGPDEYQGKHHRHHEKNEERDDRGEAGKLIDAHAPVVDGSLPSSEDDRGLHEHVGEVDYEQAGDEDDDDHDDHR